MIAVLVVFITDMVAANALLHAWCAAYVVMFANGTRNGVNNAACLDARVLTGVPPHSRLAGNIASNKGNSATRTQAGKRSNAGSNDNPGEVLII